MDLFIHSHSYSLATHVHAYAQAKLLFIIPTTLDERKGYYDNDEILNAIMAEGIVHAARKHAAPEGLVYTYGTAGVGFACCGGEGRKKANACVWV